MPESLLPIEKDRELLAEYGRAFAWFNLVESLLYVVIHAKGKLLNADQVIIKKLLERKTLGAKINIAKSIIDPVTEKVLRKLVEIRNELSHSVTSEEVDLSNPQKSTGNFIILDDEGKKRRPLTKEWLAEGIILAQSASDLLRKDMLKGTPYENY